MGTVENGSQTPNGPKYIGGEGELWGHSHRARRRRAPQANDTRDPRECCQRKEEGHKSNDPKDTMMRQTSGRVAALTVAVFCVLGLIWIPHQALAQGSSSESRSSSIADSTGAKPVTINNAYTNTQGYNARANAGASGSAYNGFGKAVGTARSGSYSNFGATDTFTDTNGYSFNGVAINNADASASSFPPYYRGYGSGWYGR